MPTVELPSTQTEKPKNNWWEDLRTFARVVAEVSSEAYSNLLTRLAEAEVSFGQKPAEEQAQKENVTQPKKSEIKRVYDVASGRGSLTFRSSARSREKADPNARQRKRVTEYTEESDKLKETLFYQRGAQTGSEVRKRETVYRGKEDREKAGTIITREKNRVVKKYEDGTERVVTREDGKLFSETFRIDEDGKKVSEGRRQVYPKPVETKDTEAPQEKVKTVEEELSEIRSKAQEVYGSLWEKGSENKVKKVLESQEFKNAEAELLAQIYEIVPRLVNIEQFRRSGMSELEISQIVTRYAKGIQFGMMMSAAPEIDAKLGPFVDLMRLQLAKYNQFAFTSGILSTEPSFADIKSTSTKKQEAVESTQDIVSRITNFHEVISNYPEIRGLFDRFSDLVDLRGFAQSEVEAVIHSDNEEEKTLEYFNNKLQEILNFNFPGIETNLNFYKRIKDSIITGFELNFREDFFTRNGLDADLPKNIFLDENAVNLFNIFLTSVDLRKLLDENFTTKEIDSLIKLSKINSEARSSFVINYGLDNIDLSSAFISDAIKKFITSLGLPENDWIRNIGDGNFGPEFLKYFNSLTKENLDEFKNKLAVERGEKIPEPIKPTTQTSVKEREFTPQVELTNQVRIQINNLSRELRTHIYNQGQVEQLSNYLISLLPKEDLQSFISGGETSIENLMLMVKMQLAELTPEKIKEIVGDPSVFDRLKRVGSGIRRNFGKLATAATIAAILYGSSASEGVRSIARSGYDSSAKVAREIDDEYGITSGTERLFADVETTISGIDFSSVNSEQIKAYGYSIYSSFVKNLGSVNDYTAMKEDITDKISELLNNKELSTINSKEVTQEIITRVQSLVANYSNINVLEATSFAGIFEGLKTKPEVPINPDYVKPEVEILKSSKFLGVDIVDSENLGDRIYNIEINKGSKIVPTETTFNFLSNEYKVNSIKEVQNGNLLPFENLTKIAKLLSIYDKRNSFFIVGNSESGYSIVSATNLSKGREINEAFDLNLYTSASYNIKNIDMAENTNAYMSEVDKMRYNTTLRGQNEEEIGGRTGKEYAPKIHTIDLTQGVYNQSAEGQRSVREIIEDSIGDTGGTISYLDQSWWGVCSITASTTVVGDLLDLPLDTYDLGSYISAFYNDNLPYARTFGEGDILVLLPKEKRDEFYSLYQESIANIERIKNSSLSNEEKKASINNEKAKIDSYVLENLGKNSIAYLQDIIRSQFKEEINALTSLGLEVNNLTQDSKDLILSKNKNITRDSLENLIGKRTTKENPLPEILLENIDDISKLLFDVIKNGTSEDSRILIDFYEGTLTNDEWSTHRVSIIGYDEEKMEIYFKDTNGNLLRPSYERSSGKDGYLPTVSAVGNDGIYKISFNTNEYSKEEVAQTLRSIYNIVQVSRIK